MRAVTERSTGIARAQRVSDEEEHGGVDEGAGAAHDRLPVREESGHEEEQTDEQERRPEQAKSLARVTELPGVWLRRDVEHPLREVEEDLVARGGVDTLEREVRIRIGGVEGLGGLERLGV